MRRREITLPTLEPALYCPPYYDHDNRQRKRGAHALTCLEVSEAAAGGEIRRCRECRGRLDKRYARDRCGECLCRAGERIAEPVPIARASARPLPVEPGVAKVWRRLSSDRRRKAADELRRAVSAGLDWKCTAAEMGIPASTAKRIISGTIYARPNNWRKTA